MNMMLKKGCSRDSPSVHISMGMNSSTHSSHLGVVTGTFELTWAFSRRTFWWKSLKKPVNVPYRSVGRMYSSFRNQSIDSTSSFVPSAFLHRSCFLHPTCVTFRKLCSLHCKDTLESITCLFKPWLLLDAMSIFRKVQTVFS